MEKASYLLESAYRGRGSVVNFENSQYSTDIFEKIIENSIHYYKKVYKSKILRLK